MNNIDIANKIATETNGNVWTAKNSAGDVTKIRVYHDKGCYAEINNDGVNIDKVGRNKYDDVKTVCNTLGVTTYRR